MKATAKNNEVINKIDEEIIANIEYVAVYDAEDVTEGAVREDKMNNNDIRMKAQQMFREFVTACWNDKFGEDDGSMFILTGRLMKAVEWAKANGEYETFRCYCLNYKYGMGMEMAMVKQECYDTLFN